MRLLVVEDDPDVAAMLLEVLRSWSHVVDHVDRGEDAVWLASEHRFDVVLLDVGLPDLPGTEVVRRLRADGVGTPVLMLTGRQEVEARVAGLDAGADDYLPKPFALEELMARLHALLRRSGWQGDGAVLRFAGLEMDTGAHEVRRDGRRIELTRTEFLLLELFLRHPRQVLTRSQIFERVWGYDFGPQSNSLEVYVGYLRRKTEAVGEPRLLHTVRGVGYVLRQPDP